MDGRLLPGPHTRDDDDDEDDDENHKKKLQNGSHIVPKPEKWVSGVTGELPGETLWPKRRPSEKKNSKQELFPPSPGSSF